MKRRLLALFLLSFCLIILTQAKPQRKQQRPNAADGNNERAEDAPPRRAESVRRQRDREVARQSRAPIRQHEPVTVKPAIVTKRRGPDSGRASYRRRRPTLLTAEECSDDIERLCPEKQKVDNFVIIDCLQRDTKTAETVSGACQHVIWQYKRNLTQSSAFQAASDRICASDFENITECSGVPAGSQRVACMFEYKDRIQTPECLMFLNKVGTILFSDYHLIYKFTMQCQADITKFHCGRLSDSSQTGSTEKQDQPSSQGRTIECLMENVDKISPACNHEILRVAELQADDFHLDRPLYFACRDDREKLCEGVRAGQGRVFKCLMKTMTDETMSSACRKELIHRMQLRERDYKVDYSFAGVCAADVAKYQCANQKHAAMMKGGLKPITEAMSDVILCLESHMKENKPVSGECQSEMLTVRKQLMSDYHLTPEIVQQCSDAISQFCGNTIMHRGKTLHCLMGQLRGARLEEKKNVRCQAALHRLIKVTDAGSDYRVDPVIVHNCQNDIQHLCADELHSPRQDGAIYSCLLRNFNSGKMTAKCSDSLLQLQYIVSRDFTLDPQLFRACRKDALTICHAPDKWNAADQEKNPVGGIVFSCLVNQLQLKEEEEDEEDEEDDDREEAKVHKEPKKQISKECGDEVIRSLRERSSQLMLNPYVYDHCLSDLSKYCAASNGKSEMECLQENFENLEKNCANVVRKITEEQDRHPSLDVILTRSCAPMINKFCSAERSDVSKIMPCLIKNKDLPDMDIKCRAGVEHHQIISLKDYRISTAFRRACAGDVHRLCPSIKKKGEAVICLSEYVRNATLLDKNVPLSKHCQQQVRFENFIKSQDIRLSPRIQRNCRRDIKEHCSSFPPRRHMQCLRSLRWKLLTKPCQKALFDRRQLESYDSRIDARLQRVCKPMIVHYCRSREESALDCLWQHIHDENFDLKCRRVVYLRLETRVKDYRLDPLLNQLCKRDMRHYCVEFMDPKQNMTGTDYRNGMVTCLRARFKNYELSTNCQGYMRQLIVEINLNHHLDANLRAACNKDVQRECGHELEDTEGRDGDGRVTECLKLSLQKQKIHDPACQREVLRLMDDTRADVHVDPVLYKACQTELSTVCHDVVLGNGRQMSCLLWAKDDKEAKKGMSHTCRKQLQARVDMWERAARAASPNTLHELAIQLNTSDSRHFFFAFFTFVVLGIFGFGLCCGRATKRVYIDAKNK